MIDSEYNLKAEYMKRKITENISNWYTNNITPHLYLTGMRGTGKTTLITEFFSGQTAQEQLYINFETDYVIRNFFIDYFSGNISSLDQHSESNKSISGALALYFNADAQNFDSSVIIIDELHTACLGDIPFSAADNEKKSRIIFIDSEGTETENLPISFTHIKVYPMMFDEFMDNTGKEWYHEVISGHFERNRSIPELVHNEINDIFSDYLSTGGMPAVINKYIEHSENNNHIFTPEEYQLKELRNILMGIQEYESRESHKMLSLLDNIVLQMLSGNRHYIFRQLVKGTSGSYYSDPIRKLCESGILIRSTFGGHNRFYWADTGMLSAKIKACYKCDEERFDEIITRNYIAQHLAALRDNNRNSADNGSGLEYWCSNSLSEVEFILEDNSRKIAIKYIGNSKKKIRSLQIYDNQYSADEKIAVGDYNFYIMGNVKLIPQYAVFCLNY